MSRPVVMCDIDGVLADFVYGFTSLANSCWPDQVPVTTTYEQPKWDGFPGMNDEKVAQTWEFVDDSTTFWRLLPPIITDEQARDLFALHYQTDFYFVTSRRGASVIYQTREWITQHIGVTRPNVILCSKKGELAHALGANFMLDDKAGNVVYAEYHNKDRYGQFKGYVLDRPYNRFDAEVVGSRVRRVTQLEDWTRDIWKVVS